MTNEEKNEKVFTLRIRKDIFERIKAEADKNKRSITKHIEFILENSIED